MRFQPEVRIAIGLILAFLLVVAGTGFAYFNSIRAVEYGKSVKKGLELLAALESLLQVLRNSQTASVYFATTGDVKALSKFEQSSKSVVPHLEFIKGLASTDRRRYILLTSLETQVRGFNNQVSGIVYTRKEKKENLKLPESFRNKLERRYENIRGRVLFIESEEKELLERIIQLHERETSNLFTTYTLLAALVIAFFFALIYALVKYTRTIRNASEAEKQIAESIFAHAPSGILILNKNLKVVSANPTAFTFLRKNSLFDRLILEVMPDLPAEAADYLDLLASDTQKFQESLEQKEARFFQDRYFNLIFWPIYVDESLKEITVLFEDVTRSVNLSKQKELLLNTFTHDIKNPLVGNQFLIKALKDDKKKIPQEREEILSQLYEGNEAVLRMVKNILNIARLQDRNQLMNVSEFNTRELLEEAKTDLESLCKTKKVQVKIDCPDNSIELKSDRILAKHLILNLTANAVNFSKEGGCVRLNSYQNEGLQVIEVQDDGPGISEEDKRKIFSASWQGELGRKVPGGTGIGLYLCNQIVDTLNGAIKCESREGSGSKFIVEFPSEPELSSDLSDLKDK